MARDLLCWGVRRKAHPPRRTPMTRSMVFDLVLGAGLLAAMIIAAAPILA